MLRFAFRTRSILGGLIPFLALLILGPGDARGEEPVASGDAASRAAARLLLRNARIFDVTTGTMSAPRSILIEGRTILQVGEIPPGGTREEARGEAGATTEIDCAGRYLLPGLFDCHVHLSQLKPLGEDSLRAALAEFVSRGVTQVRDVGGPIDVLHEMSAATASGELNGPEIFYAGPMLEHSPLFWQKFNEESPGFTVAVDSEAVVDSLLPELAAQGATLIKTFNKWDPEVYRHLVEVAPRLSLRIVHDPGEPLFHTVPMDQALDLGVTSIEHAKSPWPVVLNDELKAEHDRLLAEKPDRMTRMPVVMKVAGLGVESVSTERLRTLAAKMNEKGAYLCPTLHVLLNMEKSAIESSKKQMGADSLPEPALQMIRTMTGGMAAVSRYFVRELAASGVKMLVGQDGCDPTATAVEMRMMREDGVDAAEVLRGATLYPARWLDVDDRLGSIAPGKEADLVVLEGNPLEDMTMMQAVSFVVHRGSVIRPSSESSAPGSD